MFFLFSDDNPLGILLGWIELETTSKTPKHWGYSGAMLNDDLEVAG